MAKALNCWNYELVDKPECFCKVLGGTGKDVNVVTQLSSELYSDMDTIDVNRNEVLLKAISSSMLILHCHDSVMKVHLYLQVLKLSQKLRLGHGH